MGALPNGVDGASFLMRVAANEIPNIEPIWRAGHNESVGTTYVELWDGQVAYPWLDAATAMTVSSDNANDVLAGTGLWSLIIYGLDANWLQISEVIIMNGQTPVTTVNEYLRVNYVRALTVGSNDSNVGRIYTGTGTVTAGVPATVYADMQPAEGSTHACLYSVPASKTFYLIDAGAAPDTAKTMTVGLFTRDVGNGYAWVLDGPNDAYQESISREFAMPVPVTEKSDAAFKCRVDATTADVTGHMYGILVDN